MHIVRFACAVISILHIYFLIDGVMVPLDFRNFDFCLLFVIT